MKSCQMNGMKGEMLLILGIGLFYSLASCERKPSPEDVLRNWLMHMSAGECEKAVGLEVQCCGELDKVVENCEPYELKIKSISCEIREETAECFCAESREGATTVKYGYDLKKVDGEWKMAVGY